MPVNPTYPGVYIEEIPSGVRSIRGVATSVAAFIGTFDRGLENEAVRVLSLSDFEREYGGLTRDSEASYAVQQFFLNGGSEAWIVRVGHPGEEDTIPALTAATAAISDLAGGTDLLDVVAGRQIRGEPARNPGDWGNFLRLEISHNSNAADATFNLGIKEVRVDGDRTSVVRQEVFRNLTMAPNTANNAVEVVNAGSLLVQLAVDDAFGTTDEEDLPEVTGTLGDDLAAALPALSAATALTIGVNFGGAIPNIAPVAVDFDGAGTPASHAAFAAVLQERLRATATDASVPVALRPYLSGIVVTLTGEGTTADPRRFHIQLGQGGRPLVPAAVMVFAGGDAGAFGLDTPTFEGPLQVEMGGGDNGGIVDADGVYLIPVASFTGNAGARTGLYALEDVDLFNILCIPDAPRIDTANNAALAVYSEALAYVTDRRAMMIVDIPETVTRIGQMETWLGENANLRSPNTAVYFPRTFNLDALNQNRPRSFASSGTIAGLWARTDASRGVWKAPAGTDARLRAVRDVVYAMTDSENGVLNPLGCNCLRQFPIYGSVCWGARTLDGADQIASDWKYVPVRRTTLFIEESLYRGTQWVVFEPNDEPLWAQIRLNVGAFMHDLFRQGAFQGTMPQDAYRVKCDAETTTQSDIDNGIVNIEVAFAPLKPAEFVILKIQQIARRADS